MTPLARIQANNGRVVLVVFVALLTAWGLSLVRQAHQYVPEHVPLPDNSDLTYKRRQLLDVTTQSMLEQYYRELGVTTRRLDPTGQTGPAWNEVVVMLHPRAQAPEKLVDELVLHVERGGRLVVFTETELDFLKRFGLNTTPIQGGAHQPGAVAATVETAFVKTALGPAYQQVVSEGATLIPLLTVEGRVIAGMAGIGKGQITVVTARLADYEWIEREDNPVFLANLLLEAPEYRGRSPVPAANARTGLATVASVAVLDYDAEILRRLYRLDLEMQNRIAEARRRWNYDSFWQLIKENPVSAGLLQLMLALLVFALSRARRLGDPLPDVMARHEMPGSLAARANLFERSGAYRLAISRAVRHTNRWLGAKLGMSGDPTSDELRQSLEALNPRAAQKFAHLAQFVTNVSEGNTSADDRSLSAVWNLIDSLRKEMP